MVMTPGRTVGSDPDRLAASACSALHLPQVVGARCDPACGAVCILTCQLCLLTRPEQTACPALGSAPAASCMTVSCSKAWPGEDREDGVLPHKAVLPCERGRLPTVLLGPF